LPAQRILIADDEPRLLHIVSMYLDMEGYEVIAVEDGKAAVREVEAGGFDLALLDVMMPGVDGYEVCRRIRASPELNLIPVLLFTSLSSDSDAELGRLAGATHMITKPFSLPGLGAVLRSCFARSADAIAV
jgi:DNA-binding response OmpR family regulator